MKALPCFVAVWISDVFAFCLPLNSHPGSISKAAKSITPKRGIRLFFAFLIASLPIPAPFAYAQSILTHQIPPALETGSAKPIGHLAPDRKLHLVLTLPLQNEPALENFVRAVANPSSPSYHHYLTVEQFTQRFGPSQEDYDSVVNFAKANGLKVVGASRNRLNLDVEGPVAAIEAAFHLRMNTYQHPTENRTFYAPDREPTLDLQVRLWHISGLDNFSTPLSELSKRPAEQANSSPSATTGSGPSASFLGSDMRAAYYGGTALTGTGQSVGLLEFRGVNMADLSTYFVNVGQTNNVPITLISTDGTSTACLYSNGCDDTEQILDITQVIGMAPGLSSLVVYVGSSDASLLNAMATATPLNAQLSISWAWSPADPSTDDPYFMEFAAQGQSVFAAAGDKGAWSSSTVYVFPADDPYVTSVGGTDLQTSSAAGPWSSESVWLDSGGGISPNYFSIPSWQATAALSCPLCSTAYRNGPDVAGNANWTFYVCANQTTCTSNYWGGTSFAAPMWAGYLALANQQSVAQGHGTIGFLDPSLYALAEQSSYSTLFHDITSGSNGYAAGSGYDLATGLGSPNGAALINALSLVPNIGVFTGSVNLTIAPGTSGSTSITTWVFGGFNSSISLSASGQPTGVTAGFGSSTIAAPGDGSTQLTLTVSSAVSPGTYPITITAAGGGVTQTATVSLVVPAPTFSLSQSPASVSVADGSSGSSTITTTSQYGFNSAISLAVSGQPTGITVSFNPPSIGAPGNGTSQMTVTVGSTVATGTYPITVTGTGAGVTETATVNVVVVPPPDFSVSTSDSKGTTIEGNSDHFTIFTNYSNGFNSAVALSASGLPTGDTITINPATIAAPGYGSAAVTVAIGTNTVPGVYPITIIGMGGGITHSVTYTETVPAPDFTLYASLTSPSVYQGGSDSFLVQTVGSGFNSAITLSVSGQPAGVSVAYNPASFPAPGNGEGSITLTVASTTIPGTYPITVTAVGGGVTHSVTTNMTVLQSPDFSLSVSPATLTVYQGATASALIATSVSGGFNSPVYLNTGGPAYFGINISFSPSPIPAPGSGTSTMTIGVAPFVQAGTYTIPIGGAGGGINHQSLATISLTVLQSPGFGQVNVGSTASAIPFTFAFNSPVTLGSIEIVTQGIRAQDFKDAGTGSCKESTAYEQGQSCTVNVVFSPTIPGTRFGAAVLKDSSGNTIAIDYLRGVGEGPELTFSAGKQTTIPTSSLAGPKGVLVDSGGNIYIADTNNNRVLKETATANGYVESTVTSDLLQPTTAAMDGAGNLYVVDKNYSLHREALTSIGYSESVISTGSGATAVALDGGGDVFYSNYNSIDEIANDGSYGEISQWGYGFNNPSGLVVDDAGNIFVADTGNNVVKEILSSGSVLTLLDGLSAPTGIGLDGGGNLYVSDTGNNRVLEILKTGGYTTVRTVSGDFSAPAGLAVSGAGNLYVANSGTNTISEIDFSDPPEIAFVSTSVGTTSTDSPKTVTLQNIGNADLIFPIPTSGNNPSLSTGFTLDNATSCPTVDVGSASNGVLAAGSTCNLSIDFIPQATGSVSGSAVLTDNNLNAIAPNYVTQSISLNGSATQGTPSINWLAPVAITYGTALSATQLDATASVPGTFSYSPAAGTVPGAGTQTLSVTFTPTDTLDYTSATSSVQLTVNKATPGILWATPTPITYGTPLSGIQLDATASVPGNLVYTPAAGTVLAPGSQTLSVTSTPSDTTDYTSATQTVQLTVNPVTTTSPALQFIPVTPCRIVDTRGATGPFGGPKLAARSTRTFNIPQSPCGIPSTAVAYSLNATVVPSGSTLNYLTIWPAGETQPNVSTLNSGDGRTKANATITPAGTNGGVSVYVTGATQFILDIDGYFVPAGTSSSGLQFFPLTPCRIADTRSAAGPLGGPTLTGGVARSFPILSSSCGIPAAAQAYSLNITAVPHGGLGWLTAWPTGESQPTVSTLNAPTGTVVANAAIVPAGNSGNISIFVSNSADVILDVNGYFAPPSNGGLSLYTVNPCRILDTRFGTGSFKGTLTVPVQTSSCAPQAEAQAYVLNATVIPSGSLNYLTLWADGESQPNVSTLNAYDGAVTSNLAIVPNIDGTIDAYSTNQIQLIFDLSSYFAP